MNPSVKTVLCSLVQHLQPGRWATINIHALESMTGIPEERLAEILAGLEMKNLIERQLIPDQADFKIRLNERGYTINLNDPS